MVSEMGTKRTPEAPEEYTIWYLNVDPGDCQSAGCDWVAEFEVRQGDAGVRSHLCWTHVCALFGPSAHKFSFVPVMHTATDQEANG